MLSKSDQISTIGYDGNSAIVDGKVRSRYGAMSSKDLTDAGMFREAAAAALFDKSEEEISYVVQEYNKKAGSSYTEPQLERLFGISVPEQIKKVLVL